MTQAEKARRLLELHHADEPLVLPNAWDVASARIFEDAGFPAIATTSAGIANSLGYADGERIPREEMLGIVARITAAVGVPVTADMEGGYGDVAATARGVVEAGAVGFNYEDGRERPSPHLISSDEMCHGIRAAMEAGRARGVELVINARTDVYLSGFGPPEERFDETVRRCLDYAKAGAACVFVPGLTDEKIIGALVAAVRMPVNILGTASAPPIRRLSELGVRRVSVGSGPMRATMGLTRRIAEELRSAGTYRAMTEGAMSYLDANALYLPELRKR